MESGGVPEWFKGAVLNTVAAQVAVGSNPTPSTSVDCRKNWVPWTEFCNIEATDRTVGWGGDDVVDVGPTRLDHDLLHERANERLARRSVAGLQEIAHLPDVGRDRLQTIEHRAALHERRPRLGSGVLKEFLTFLVLPKARHDVPTLKFRCLHGTPQLLHRAAHVGELLLDGLQLQALLTRDTIHLVVDEAYQVPDLGLREDVLPNLFNDQLLEILGVEARGLAGPLAALIKGLANVVVVLSRLCRHGCQGPTTAFALDQPTQQAGAGHATGMHHGGTL